MSVNIKPLADYVVVQQEEPETKTKSGILIPTNAQEKPETMVVVAIGPDVKGIKVKDKVLYIDEYGKSKAAKVDGTEYTVIKQSNVVAVVEE